MGRRRGGQNGGQKGGKHGREDGREGRREERASVDERERVLPGFEGFQVLRVISRFDLELFGDVEQVSARVLLERRGCALRPLEGGGDVCHLVTLVVHVLSRHLGGHLHGGHSELELLLELLNVGGERAERARLRAHDARIIALHHLLRAQLVIRRFSLVSQTDRMLPPIVVSVWVVDTLERAHAELDNVMIVDEVSGCGGDGKVALGGQHHILHFEAVGPLVMKLRSREAFR